MLDALAGRAYLSEAVDRARAAGGTIARLAGDNGRTRAVRPVTPAPSDRYQLERLGHDLARDTTAGGWRIWLGERWLSIPGAAGTPA